MTQDTSELYLAYWDTLGFEAILNLSQQDKRAMWAVLGDKPPPKLPVHAMIMRAKANPQRFPEIWTFWSCIGRKELLKYAQDEPQALADSIRRLGQKVFVTAKEKVVIS
jgi:hypothetical protein